MRSGWQAADLGIMLAACWWLILFTAAALPALILFLPLLVVFYDEPLWALFIIWWLKPFWERLPLYYASRRIFSEHLSMAELVAKLLPIYRIDFFPTLLWRRLSLHRSFNAPVTVLENLQGKQRNRRITVLHGKFSDTALGNQFVCFCFELILLASMLAIVMFLLPERWALDLLDDFDELSLTAKWIYSLAGFLSMMLVLPFYCMGGFSQYLNRRIELEAWDIEIAFRSLAARLGKPLRSAAVICALCVIPMLISGVGMPVAHAAVQHDNESAKQLINDVLGDEQFGQEKIVRKWRFKNLYEENKDKFPDWLIEFFEWLENLEVSRSDDDGDSVDIAAIIKLLLISAFVILLIYCFYKFRTPLLSIKRSSETNTTPEVMFGMNIRPESLPADVPEQAMSMWQKGQQREALGLLYRASLSRLVDQFGFVFKASFTEAECAAIVHDRGIESLSAYFSQLTRSWRQLAYGHRLPDSSTVNALCENWSREMSVEQP